MPWGSITPPLWAFQREDRLQWSLPQPILNAVRGLSFTALLHDSPTGFRQSRNLTLFWTTSKLLGALARDLTRSRRRRRAILNFSVGGVVGKGPAVARQR